MKRLLGCLLACSLLTAPSLATAQEAGGIATVATVATARPGGSRSRLR